MACAEDLANRIRELIASEDGYTERKMFAGLEADRRTALPELCRERLPEPPFAVSAKAWVARGAP